MKITSKPFIPFCLLYMASAVIWAFLVLPEIGEIDSGSEAAAWLATQGLITLTLALLASLRKRSAYVALLGASGFITLYGLGMLGWGLMGTETPISLYASCAALIVAGLGLIYRSLQALGAGRSMPPKRRYLDD